MSFVRDVMKKATIGTATWLGSTFGGAKGAAIGKSIGESIGSSLFDRKAQGGSGAALIDTSVGIPDYGGRMQAFKPSMSRGNRDYAKSVNFATLNAAWDARFSKFFTDDYKVKRTLVRKKIV
jgi:hypothetical protein|tara:strand:- start:93 stop:458 length:366 start_codon:yes stop_codon:yes gene_type:complete